MIHLIGLASLTLYVASAVGFLLAVGRRQEATVRPARLLLFAAFVLHTVAALTLALVRRTPLLYETSDYLTWISWLMPAAYLLFGSRLQSPLLGALIVPLTAVFFLVASVLMHLDAPAGAKDGHVLPFVFHIVPALIAEACLLLAFVMSCALLLQERRLRKKNRRFALD